MEKAVGDLPLPRRPVFCCPSSADKPAVLALANQLRARGIDLWVDRFEIRPGTDFVAAIDAALEASQVGLVCLSEHTRESGWVRAEVSYLLYARIPGLVPGPEHRERANRAGRYRWWRVANESHALDDGLEAVRNHLAGRDFDAAGAAATACIAAMH